MSYSEKLVSHMDLYSSVFMINLVCYFLITEEFAHM